MENMENDMTKMNLFFEHVKETGNEFKITGEYYEIEVQSQNYNCHSFTLPFNMGEDGNYYQYSDDEKIELILEAIRSEYDDFDVSYETYKLLDEEGHGIDGEEYDMMNVYKGQEDIKNQIANVHNSLDDFYRSGALDKAYELEIFNTKNNNRDKPTVEHE